MSGTQMYSGRLAPYVEGYRAWLLERGHTPVGARHRVTHLGHLGRWMASENVGVHELSSAAVDACIASRRAAYRDVTARGSLLALLGYLRSEGVVLPEPRGELAPVDQLLVDYRRWLAVERELAPATVDRCQKLARRFLVQRASAGEEFGVSGLTGADVSAFLLGECARLKLGAAASNASGLRSLLRFLHLRGLTDLALAECVPSVASWRDARIPRSLPHPEVEALLGSCDRSSLGGARDFAILMLLARLGLRAVEVARLELGDLHWRAGEIEVDGKGRRRDRLPLPGDVGEALVGYLSLRGRGARHVFLALRAPIRPMGPTTVSLVVRRACARAGLAQISAHRLRHALASKLLAEGASLVDISQVLRHRDLASTAIYAKVDFARLREVAQAWPETGAGR